MTFSLKAADMTGPRSAMGIIVQKMRFGLDIREDLKSFLDVLAAAASLEKRTGKQTLTEVQIEDQGRPTIPCLRSSGTALNPDQRRRTTPHGRLMKDPRSLVEVETSAGRRRGQAREAHELEAGALFDDYDGGRGTIFSVSNFAQSRLRGVGGGGGAEVGGGVRQLTNPSNTQPPGNIMIDASRSA